MDKYFKIKKYKNGDIISMFIIDLYNEYKYENILFVRTCTTGDWLDNLLVNEKNITRILYDTNKTKKENKYHKSTILVNSNNLDNTLISLNKKFSLICIDPFHEYYESNRDFTILSSLLNDDGVLISHDCFPSNKNMATPKFKNGAWCGETYIAFVEFSYKNPNMFYGILDIDTGIGIISKIQFQLLTNIFDIKKQEYLLLLHNNNNEPYEYFYKNSKDIINTIYLSS